MGGIEVKKSGEELFREAVKGKSVLFITTKNLDYIRNTQEIRLIKDAANKLELIGSESGSYLKRLVKVYYKLLVTGMSDYDMVFIGFAPQLVLPFWHWKFKKKTICIDFFISLYDTMVKDRRKFKEQSFWGRMLKAIDKKTLKKSDVVITDTKAHAKYFVEELNAERSKIITLYLEADQNIYYPRRADKPEHLKNKFVVLYFGSVLPLQGVDIVLRAYDLLKNNDRIHMYMIGKVGDKLEKPLNSNIEYIDWLAQDKLAEYIAASDLCLAGHFNKNIDKAKRTIPGKAYIYCAMEKKIILGDNEANRELFPEENENIFYVPMGDADALAATILKLSEE